MQVNVAGLRRNLRNIVHDYSGAQRKVWEATSNDAWGPSSTIMAEIADLTNNVVVFTEIMQMIWKRLNDHGKNWRQVYKALVLLEYLIKTGSEKVAQQCKENIFFIKTLKDFQYLEEGKDQGQNVREKAKQLANLLQDDDRLRNERTRALKMGQNLRNIVHNYSGAQRKVWEATSNDAWGPSSTIMAEIADLTNNVVVFTEIMQMIWKRLNDHGKNWRQVYKALVLLEYLIKTGSEKVAQQCKENIFFIKTLKDFQYLEEGKDQGQNVREKAKQLANLLQDDDRLRNERTRALKMGQNLRNIVHNYSGAQRKVREATSNDAWGPSSTIMAEIADLTNNVVVFTEIMQMIWKRLNDHGKNWRQVYKALVLLEYLIKTGSEKVAQQCKENIFFIKTLKDFQYLEEGKDQGQNVREKAKQLANLLQDDDRLRNERTRALKMGQNLRNIVHNYSGAQRKVREATSNDAWGPSSTIMAEIADLTNNVVVFTEIMQMIWKRLNDHGKNWRQVYKALVLLEYLIKTGSEKVAQQCKENIFFIKTLKDFQYLEEGKDQGQNVREKAKQLANLLQDNDRLRNERTRALKMGRNLRNIVHNYSGAQRKVREATSNDAWGPSSTIMAEIADLTYNVVVFTEIMQMIWKRLNDHGKNWRQVYKALVLLEYLIKTGSEKVAQQCKENIFFIKTLKDFQYLEEGKDQGQNVREKAKQLANLLQDDDRLRNERTRALKMGLKKGNEMQVNVAGLRRNLRNIVHNYSDAQRKVREATSNDAWGPSSTIMAEIADLTYNVVAFTEIMQMIWKRLNDHGKNWRHVYKALVLLEYLIKTGSEKVAQQCKENIFFIKTLKDFQYLEEGKDQGQNVREKAKQLANLLQDDDRLRNERARALKAKERFAQSASGFGSEGGLETPSSPKFPAFRGDWNSSRESPAELPRDLEVARPQTAGEEELQLQLALAMSREEAEQEEQKRRSDDVRLQLALSQSQQDFKATQHEKPPPPQSTHMVDLLDVNLGETAPVDAWGMPQPPQNTSPWRTNTTSSPLNQQPASVDPWQPVTSMSPRTVADPWNTSKQQIAPTLAESAIRNDPWSPDSHSSSTDLDEFDIITNRNRTTSPKTNGTSTLQASDPFELNLLGDVLPPPGPSPSTGATKKTPQSFLGENSALVNLDNLVTSKAANNAATANPFSDAQTQPPRQVFTNQVPKPSMNEIKQTPFMGSPQFGASATPSFAAGTTMGAFVTPMPSTTLPPYPTANGGQFGTPSPSFNANGTFGAAPVVQPIQDPWQPVSSNTNTSQLSAPWMKPGYTFY